MPLDLPKARPVDKTITLIGCSPVELMQHIERQFLPGMAWNNRHLWHVDHIKPCSAFDLLDPEQQKRCFHYSNLRPMWARDNLSKGGVRPHKAETSLMSQRN